jgi:hypothetical protein
VPVRPLFALLIGLVSSAALRRPQAGLLLDV